MSFLSVNYTEQNYNILFQNCAKGKQNVTVKESASAKAISTQDMTMEEYKQYIHDKISQIPINPTQSGYNWNIEITDEGFEAMKNNPEYETYVLDCIRTNFSGTDPFRTSNYSILHFGATKAESYGIGWCTDNSDLEESDDSFWEHRAEHKKHLEELYEEFLEKRAATKKWQDRQLKEGLAAMDAEGIRLPDASGTIRQIPQAVAAYEANVLTEPAGISGFDSAATGANA